MPPVLEKRLVFVTGKGGVGKSTVATALGLLSARSGRRTIIAELAGQQRVGRSFERAGALFEEIELDDGLFTISIDPQDAMDEYFRVNTGTLGQAVGSSRVFQAFAMATPGMREMLQIGKVWELAQPDRRTEGAEPYDLVIVDAPATGHGVAILKTPSTFAGIARVGPIAHQAGRIAKTVADRDFTGLVAVCLPEEMPVNETIALDQSLREAGLAVDLVVLNAVYPERFSEAELDQAAAALGGLDSTLGLAALRAARSEHHRASGQREQRQRLTDELAAPTLDLPYVFADELGPQQLETLATALREGMLQELGSAQ